MQEEIEFIEQDPASSLKELTKTLQADFLEDYQFGRSLLTREQKTKLGNVIVKLFMSGDIKLNQVGLIMRFVSSLDEDKIENVDFPFII